MLPAPRTAITLDPKRTDAWGVPSPHISLSLSENERAIAARAGPRGPREMIEYCGFRMNFIGSMLGLDSKDVFPDADPISRFIFRRGFSRSLAHGRGDPRVRRRAHGLRPATSVLNELNQSGTSRTCSSPTAAASCRTASSARR